MYTPDVIKARLQQRPFRPLRIIAGEGLQFDVYHPDLVWVGVRDVHIGTPSSEYADIYERTTRVALVNVVALEDIPTDLA